MKPEIDGVVAIEFGRAKRQPILGRAAREIVLGQVGPVDRRGIVGGQHDDLPLVLPPAQHFRGGEAGGAPADDHDLPRLAGSAGGRKRLCALLADNDLAVALIDQPGIDWAEGGRMQRLSGPKAETGVMPRTSYGVVDDQPFRERTAIMGADGADGEDFRSPAREQHRLLSDMAEELASVRQVGERDPLREVCPRRLGLALFHSMRSAG